MGSIVAHVAELERTIGLYDLRQFTPKVRGSSKLTFRNLFASFLATDRIGDCAHSTGMRLHGFQPSNVVRELIKD